MQIVELFDKIFIQKYNWFKCNMEFCAFAGRGNK